MTTAGAGMEKVDSGATAGAGRTVRVDRREVGADGLETVRRWRRLRSRNIALASSSSSRLRMYDATIHGGPTTATEGQGTDVGEGEGGTMIAVRQTAKPEIWFYLHNYLRGPGYVKYNTPRLTGP